MLAARQISGQNDIGQLLYGRLTSKTAAAHH
ncbi:MAG: hypothetical protein RLZZ80_329, partial [Pseudomonadota bacterium]